MTILTMNSELILLILNRFVYNSFLCIIWYCRWEYYIIYHVYQLLTWTLPPITPWSPPQVLFSSSSMDWSRPQQTKESISNMDRHINNYLILVSPFVQTTAARKTIEWLIYRLVSSVVTRSPRVIARESYLVSHS